MPLDPDRRGELLGAKLRALVGDAGVKATFPGGTARVDAPHARGWVLADADPARALGPALVWAHRHDVADLHVLVDDADVAGALARRAREFAAPPTVHHVDGRALRDATPTAPPDLDAAPPPAAREFVRALKAAGAEPVVERGVLVGEINGLEVARVIVDDEGAYLEVGVGKHDRHAQSLVHGNRPTAEALADAVAFVSRHRRPGAEPHPLNRLARERWLRTVVVHDPALVGAKDLRPVSSPVERDDLRKNAPAPAIGVDAHDPARPVVVVCSTGIDLDLVPAAADVRLALTSPHDEDARLVLVVPPKDDHPITRRLAGALVRPAEIAVVDL